MKNLFLILLVSGSFQRLGAQGLTVREVYDLQVGDEVGIRAYVYGPLEFRWMKVINRIHIGSDSLHITYYVRTLRPTMQGNIFGEDTLTVRVGDLDSPFFKQYVRHDTTIIDSVQGHWYASRESWDSTYADLCGVSVNWRYHSVNMEGLYEEREKLAYKGLGVLTRNYFFYGGPGGGTRLWEKLEYYVKNGDTCGNTKNFPIAVADMAYNSKGMVYPNPATDKLYIKGITEFSYSITDLRGLELVHGIGREHQPIQLELAAGVYIIRVSNGKHRIWKKVIVEH